MHQQGRSVFLKDSVKMVFLVTHTHTHTYARHTHTHTYTHTHTHTHTHVHTHMHDTHTHTRTHTHTHTHTHFMQYSHTCPILTNPALLVANNVVRLQMVSNYQVTLVYVAIDTPTSWRCSIAQYGRLWQHWRTLAPRGIGLLRMFH